MVASLLGVVTTLLAVMGVHGGVDKLMGSSGLFLTDDVACIETRRYTLIMLGHSHYTYIHCYSVIVQPNLSNLTLILAIILCQINKVVGLSR